MPSATRRAVVGVMGAGEGASAAAITLAEDLGEHVSRRGWALLTGGRPVGVMAAASRGAMRVPGHLVLGVLPHGGDATGDATGDAGSGGRASGGVAAVDVAVFTGMGAARNAINVLSCDAVVVCGGGGPGTASEAAFALIHDRPLLLLAAPEPWPRFFGALSPEVTCTDALEDCCRWLAARLDRPGAGA
jgi:predicted Rossmann-fold nucleotide-binding protein